MSEEGMPYDMLSILREKYPDANEREAWAVEMLIAVHQYLPETLTRLTSGKRTETVINDWLNDTYGLNITYPDRKMKMRR